VIERRTDLERLGSGWREGGGGGRVQQVFTQGAFFWVVDGNQQRPATAGGGVDVRGDARVCVTQGCTRVCGLAGRGLAQRDGVWMHQ
jgi:hypothetical protein